MPVNQLSSGARVLAAFEAIAANETLGLRALARLQGENPSAMQRAVLTLANAGWIQKADRGGWEVAARARLMLGDGSGLQVRAQPVLDALRDDVDETVILAAPKGGRITMVAFAEGRQFVRTSPLLGQVASPPERSSLALAFLAHLPPHDVAAFLDKDIDDTFRRRLALVRRRGWAIRLRETDSESAGIGAPIFDARGDPVGALCISAPAQRMLPGSYRGFATKAVAAARSLSVD